MASLWVPTLGSFSRTQDVLANFGGDVESLLVGEVLQEEFVDLPPGLFVGSALQGKKALLPVAREENPGGECS